MSVPPDVHSTKRDDSAIDYSVSGLSVPLQFVINNEPHLPRNREQKKLVRSHAKRQSRAVEKRRNTMPVHRREILQRQFNQLAAQSKSSITKANANVTSIPSQSVTESKVAIALSDGSESDAYLTPESSYLASEDSEARSLSASPELDPSSSRLKTDRYQFDRCMFDTSE
jgi:hypothetical protein